jgi:hypothetical protein
MWQSVTVAMRSVSRIDAGLPTMSLAPTITASAPRKGTPVDSISFTAASAVLGAISV